MLPSKTPSGPGLARPGLLQGIMNPAWRLYLNGCPGSMDLVVLRSWMSVAVDALVWHGCRHRSNALCIPVDACEGGMVHRASRRPKDRQMVGRHAFLEAGKRVTV